MISLEIVRTTYYTVSHDQNLRKLDDRTVLSDRKEQIFRHGHRKGSRTLRSVGSNREGEKLGAYGRLRLHKLSGDLAEFWSIDINGPWRLLFIFEDGDAYEVTIRDTH